MREDRAHSLDGRLESNRRERTGPCWLADCDGMNASRRRENQSAISQERRVVRPSELTSRGRWGVDELVSRPLERDQELILDRVNCRPIGRTTQQIPSDRSLVRESLDDLPG